MNLVHNRIKLSAVCFLLAAATGLSALLWLFFVGAYKIIGWIAALLEREPNVIPKEAEQSAGNAMYMNVLSPPSRLDSVS